jgi:hypothetical protein
MSGLPVFYESSEKPDYMGRGGYVRISLWAVWLLDGEEKTDSHTVCISSKKVTYVNFYFIFLLKRKHLNHIDELKIIGEEFT